MIPVSMPVIGLGVSFSGIAPTYLIGLGAVMVSGLGIAAFHPEGAKLMNCLAGDRKATP
jgi:FSR family fosmidomycin resistance protein-like MFS transporter